MAAFSLAIIVLVVVKQEQMFFFYDLVFPWQGLPLARKAIHPFICSKHDALRSMKQGSCIMHH